ncbi:hypothetical protein [Butyricicoccus porcorum]|uniref:hypothetical protein n=1 Tax=Butyricicoccus porcorum TaxID=1945634 RepID=UPI003F4ADBFD
MVKYKILYSILKEFIDEAGYSVRGFAQSANISPSTLQSAIEHESKMRIATFINICSSMIDIIDTYSVKEIYYQSEKKAVLLLLLNDFCAEYLKVCSSEFESIENGLLIPFLEKIEKSLYQQEIYAEFESKLRVIRERLGISIRSEKNDYTFRDTVSPGWKETRSPQEIAVEVEKFKRGYDAIKAQKLLDKFGQLNNTGQEIAIDCVEGLAGNPKYQRKKD